jgi:hypothetical protein
MKTIDVFNPSLGRRGAVLLQIICDGRHQKE